jgi:DNA polymerase-1
MTQKKPTLYLIDGAGYYYRAYFGIRQYLSNSKGTPTNAIYGFALMLQKILKDKSPDYALMVFDSKEKTFRHEMYQLYKAHRPKMPDDLSVQLPFIDRLVEGYNLASVKEPGYEADDLIGTIAGRAAKDGYEVVIVTSDKDMMQLIEPGVRIYDSMKDKVIGPKEVEEKFGVSPDKVADVLGLMGDSSDNIPGVPGVGEKTAKALVIEHGGMEEVLKAAEGMTKKKLKENLIEFADQARLSKQLATIKLDSPVKFDPTIWKVGAPDMEKLKTLYTELEFSKMLEEITPAAPKTPRKYIGVLDIKTFDAMMKKLRKSRGFAVDTETTSTNAMEATLVGMSFSVKDGEAYYLPLRHDYEGAPTQLSLEQVMPEIKELLEDESIPKYGQNIKYDMLVFASEGITIKPIGFDTMVASYILNPSMRHGLSALALDRLGEKMIEFSDICGSGAKQITFNLADVDEAVEYAAEDADITYRLTGILRDSIREKGFVKLNEEIEIPLIETLFTIERNGVLVDTKMLESLGGALGSETDKYEKQMIKEAGEEFNVNSPKQLGEILFGKLGLAGGKKTKTGYSTNQSVLERLSEDHPLPRLALEYRQLAKLKSTYADALPKMINQKTGRIHTSFNQTVAATGRLSSSDPNLQNIPIRTKLGRKIRKAFIAPEGFKLLSSDYSQIELRLLAHFSDEKILIEAFSKDEDIHSRTAAEVFDVAPPFVTEDMRRVAKTVNFGIIYGQTAFGLSNELKIPMAEAQRYIKNYFERYPAIRVYMDKLISDAKENGFVTTIMGRRRYLPDINASNRQARQFAERNAVNSPIQGSAADLIKMAMNTIHRRLKEEQYESIMILQVHDELVFETPDSEVERLTAMVREEMEGVYKLKIPLTVDIHTGANWDEAH